MNTAPKTSPDGVFAALEQEVEHARKTQAVKSWYAYPISGTIAGGATSPFLISIMQGMDFQCEAITGSAFYYSSSVASAFPMPMSATAAGNWASRGLTINMITDTGTGRTLCSGAIPFELIATPGYGVSLTRAFPLRYMFQRNSKVQFDIRSLETNTAVAHQFNIVLIGYNYMTAANPGK
jgi:hypothetical protein